MNIAIDIRSACGEKAGKGWYTFNLVQNLLKIDQKNNYLLYNKTPIAGFQQFKNARQKSINSKGIFWHKKVTKDIKEENIDIFFAPSSYIIPSLLPKSIKTIITVHDLVAFLFPNKHNKKAVILEKLFLKKAIKKASHILTVSENTKKDVYHKFNIDKGKITTVYCAASEDFKPIKKENLDVFAKKTKLPKKFFLAVGTIEPRKNYLNLLKAFNKFSKEFPDYHIIIVGKKGWGYDEIFKYIKDNYLNKKVHTLGYLSGKSLVALYNTAQALIFPSLYEGFGIPPLEAMQSACPVLASFSSSIPEVVGDSAILFHPEKHEEIYEAMKKFIKSKDLQEKLKKKGLTQSKKFSWDNSAKKLLELFEEI